MLKAVTDSKGKAALALALGLGIGYVGKKFYGRSYTKSSLADVELIKNRGSQFFKDGNFPQALKAFNEALELMKSVDETTPEKSKLQAILFKNRATTKEKLKYAIDDVIEDYKQALRYNRLYKLAYTQLARLLWKNGQEHKALKYLACANFCLEGPLFRESDREIMEYAHKNREKVPCLQFPDNGQFPLNTRKYAIWRDCWQGEDIFKIFTELTQKTSFEKFEEPYHRAMSFPSVAPTPEVPEEVLHFVERLLDAKLWLYTHLPERGIEQTSELMEELKALPKDSPFYDQIYVAFHVFLIETADSSVEINRMVEEIAKTDLNEKIIANIIYFSFHAMYVQNSNEAIEVSDKFANIEKIYIEGGKFGRPPTNVRLQREFFKLMMHMSRGEFGSVIPCVQEIDKISEASDLNCFSHTVLAMAMQIGSTEEMMIKHLELAKSMPHDLNLETILTHETLIDNQDNKPDGFTVDVSERLLTVDPYNPAANLAVLRYEMIQNEGRPITQAEFDRMNVLHQRAAVFADGEMRDMNETSYYFAKTILEASQMFVDGQ